MFLWELHHTRWGFSLHSDYPQIFSGSEGIVTLIFSQALSAEKLFFSLTHGYNSSQKYSHYKHVQILSDYCHKFQCILVHNGVRKQEVREINSLLFFFFKQYENVACNWNEFPKYLTLPHFTVLTAAVPLPALHN